MTATVLKFPLNVLGVQSVMMPRDAQILLIADQRNTVCIWALCDAEAAMDTRTFEIIGTGPPAPIAGAATKHVGSVIQQGGRFVWHVFEHIRPGQASR